MTSVLITGLGGFLGNAAARFSASNGWRITGIGRRPLSPEQEETVAYWQQGQVNVDSISSLIKQGGEPDILIHAAGNGKVGSSWDAPLDDYSKNVTTTAHILEALRLNSPDTVFVLPSSAAVYGDAQTSPFVEELITAPISPYGHHKKIAENLCSTASELYGLKTVIVRFFSLYGPGLQKQLLWDIYCKLQQQRDTLKLSGAGSNTRDFLYVDDAVNLMFLAANNVKDSPFILNGGSGHATPIKEIATQMLERVSPSTKLSFDGHNRLGDPVNMLADMKKTLDLNFSPKIKLEQGIQLYTDWAKQRSSSNIN